jgi:hypothetical protein
MNKQTVEKAVLKMNLWNTCIFKRKTWTDAENHLLSKKIKKGLKNPATFHVAAGYLDLPLSCVLGWPLNHARNNKHGILTHSCSIGWFHLLIKWHS